MRLEWHGGVVEVAWWCGVKWWYGVVVAWW